MLAVAILINDVGQKMGVRKLVADHDLVSQNNQDFVSQKRL